MKETMNLQLFAAPTNMTGKAQIATKMRELDFVTSFADNMQDLLNIMGITRMTKKQNGTILKTKTATGTLQSGTVAEGDEIPLSQFSVSETVYDTISIEKYAKAVSIEAIAEHGYDNAVTLTDEEFKSQLRDVVLDKMYDFMKTGTLKSTEDTWQMALSMAIGRVANKFKTMHKNCTGIVAFANILDVYKYIGAANITVQTAFGMNYVQNFMGVNTLFLTAEVPEGTIIATPQNNMVAYYVDPGDSEFARAGLSYTTDPAVGFLGYHTEGDYGRALSKSFALMGVRLFAEYLDAIAVITVKGE